MIESFLGDAESSIMIEPFLGDAELPYGQEKLPTQLPSLQFNHDESDWPLREQSRAPFAIPILPPPLTVTSSSPVTIIISIKTTFRNITLLQSPKLAQTITTAMTIKQVANVTPYQSRVYALLNQIPAGKVSTYAALSRALSSSPRAVGGALRRNPFAPEVPCHRVISAGGVSVSTSTGSLCEKAQLILI